MYHHITEGVLSVFNTHVLPLRALCRGFACSELLYLLPSPLICFFFSDAVFEYSILTHAHGFVVRDDGRQIVVLRFAGSRDMVTDT